MQDPEDTAAHPSGATDSGDEAARLAEIHSLFEILRRLPLDDREAVLLRFRDGLKMKEIAARLGLSVSGAKMRVHRGLEKLQKAWGG